MSAWPRRHRNAVASGSMSATAPPNASKDAAPPTGPGSRDTAPSASTSAEIALCGRLATTMADAAEVGSRFSGAHPLATHDPADSLGEQPAAVSMVARYDARVWDVLVAGVALRSAAMYRSGERE